jgi:hypothetical protein
VSANPLVSFISSNGRGFRIDASAGLTLQQTGGVPDCSAAGSGTDNLAAFLAAKKALLLATGSKSGGTLKIPQGSGAYRMSDRVPFTEGIVIEGDGWHANPGLLRRRQARVRLL